MRSLPKISWAGSVWLVCATLAYPAAAQEDIVDPENPGTQAASEDAEARDGSDESLLDPENVSPSQASSEATSQPQEMQTARFLGTWSDITAVDLSWGDQEDVFEQVAELRLRGEYGRGSSFRAVTEVEFEHWWAFDDNGDNVRASYEARAGEAYITYRQGDWSLNAGNMIHRWGVTDLIRPNDVINPIDMTIITPDRAQRRIPQLSAALTWGPSKLRITGLVVPFFVANRSWAFGRDTALFSPNNPVVAQAFPIATVLNGLFDASIQDDVQPAVSATQVPDELASGVSAGTRVATTLANTDLALGYFYGWDRTQSITLDPTAQAVLITVANDQDFLNDFDFVSLLQRHNELLGQLNELSDRQAAGETIFESKYERLHTLSLEGTRYVGPIGVRLDAAFHPEKTYLRDDFTTVRTPTLAVALGLSYEDLSSETDATLISVEGFITEPFDAHEYLVVGRRSAGAAAVLQRTDSWLESRAVAVCDFANQDVIGTLSLAHRFETWLRVGGSLVVFDVWGEDSSVTPASILDQNDFATISVDGNF